MRMIKSNKKNPHTDPIYLPFWLDKVLRDVRRTSLWKSCWEIYTADSGSILVFQLFLVCHSLMDTKICYLTLRFASELLLSVSRAQHLNWMACWHCWNSITSLTLSSVKLSWLCPTINDEQAFGGPQASQSSCIMYHVSCIMYHVSCIMKGSKSLKTPFISVPVRFSNIVYCQVTSRFIVCLLNGFLSNNNEETAINPSRLLCNHVQHNKSFLTTDNKCVH
jgi:hypothetical protein